MKQRDLESVHGSRMRGNDGKTGSLSGTSEQKEE